MLKFLSSAGALYTLNENVDFASDKNEIVVAKVDKQTGLPTHYAVKAFGQVISGDLEREIVESIPIWSGISRGKHRLLLLVAPDGLTPLFLSVHQVPAISI